MNRSMTFANRVNHVFSAYLRGMLILFWVSTRVPLVVQESSIVI